MRREQGPDGHERFSELCALAMSGSLTAAEGRDLQQHLQSCGECRDEYERYLLLTGEGMPLLARRYAGQEHKPQVPVVSDSRALTAGSDARQKVFARIAAEASQPEIKPAQGSFFWRTLARPIAGAVAACLLIVAGYRVYQAVRSRDANEKRRIEILSSEKRALADQLSTQTIKLAQLEAGNSQKLQEMEQVQTQLRAELQREAQRANQQTSALTAARALSEDQARSAAHEREALTARLKELETSYQNAQAELVSLREERARTTLRLASVEHDNAGLIAATRDQERRLHDQEQYLASDRDIREIMGARQLYMADVFDVSSDSRTRKPYGRVFYTRGKSLIFYAFDLERQSGIKNAAFQAWGRNESSQGKPVNLGILYHDSEQNRRWVLRFDDPQRLAEIDAIFVTIEPHGGSRKPTGKAFLYASLRREPNHP